MMQRIVAAAVVVFIVSVAAPAIAGEITVSDLVMDGASYAGEEVTLVGELIGDYGNRRTGFTWTQLNGDTYGSAPVADGGELSGANVGIGVRMPTNFASGLDAPGRYRRVGPIVQVTGVWKYHDPGRQGESYLDITEIVVVFQGRSLSEPPSWIAFGLGLMLLAGAAVILWRYRHRRDDVT